MIDLEAIFEKHSDEYLEFKKIETPLHPRRDICVFLLLDKLVPNHKSNMVAGAEHDQIYLETDCEKLAEVATEEDIISIIRCGVSYDESDGLTMFV